MFQGNSFTYYNDLPSMVSQLAVAGGQQYEYDSHLEGGWSWEDHVASDLTMDKIRSQVWDVVILQEYSTRPAYDEEVVCEQTVPPLDTLISAIQDNNPDTKIQFYLTWGWPHGAPDLCNMNMTQFCSYESMQVNLILFSLHWSLNATIMYIGCSNPWLHELCLHEQTLQCCSCR